MIGFVIRITSIAALALLLPVVASAAGGAAHHGGPPTPEQWKLLVFTVINFTIFVLIMRKAAGAPLRDYLSTRRKELVEAMSEAARAKEEAEKIRAEYEEKAAALEKTRADLIAEVKTIAESERERTIQAAKEASARMMEDADRTAESDLSRARQELRGETAALAAKIAADEIKAALGSDEQKRLIREFIDGVDTR